MNRMGQIVRRSIVFIGIIAIGVAVNVGLFSFFPYLHRIFTDKIVQGLTAPRTRNIVMQYKKPEKKKEAPKERKVRKVSNPNRSKGTSQLQFKFTPDLSVEGTGEVAMEQQELAAVIFEEGETDEPAVPLYQPAIPYPDRARDLEIEGILEITFTIDPRGKVTSIEVVRSPHITITNAARKIIATWRFKPAKNKGVPVHMRVRQVIEFTLE